MGRREPPLSGPLHAHPLVVQIERQGRRVALGGAKRLFAHEREADAGHPLEALVGRSGNGLERHFACVERQGAERAHRVDQEPPAGRGGDCGDAFDRVEDAGGGLAVHRRDVRDRPVCGQRPCQRGDIVGPVLRRLERHHLAAVIARHLDHALAVGAVDQDQQPAVPRHERAEHGLDHERAAALERYADVSPRTAGEAHQAIPDARVERHEVPIARAPVAQHRPFHRARGGERTRGQEVRLARRVRHDGGPEVGRSPTLCGDISQVKLIV